MHNMQIMGITPPAHYPRFDRTI